MEMESSSSCKRAKAPVAAVGQGQAAHCLVDGCDADLSLCRDYHRRHKVCEAHSKTPKVTIRGREQRFCQQCSRFHSLVEFDEGKRSCRKRLDGHNRRRRKPQPADSSSTTTSTQHSLQGGTLVSFTTPHDSSWAGGLDHDNMLQLYSTTTQQQQQQQQQQQHHNYYINNAAERSRQIINSSSSSSSFHLQNEYLCDAALSLLSVEGETTPHSNLHHCHYPAFPQPPATHDHGSSPSSTAASHHTRTFTWDH